MSRIYAILILLVNSCVHYPVSTSAYINKTNLLNNEQIIIKVIAKNNSTKKIETLELSDTKPAEEFSSWRVRFDSDIPFNSDFAVARDYPDINFISSAPAIQPDETKNFLFYWYPAHYDQGSGSLTVSLPPNFQPVKPFRITIK